MDRGKAAGWSIEKSKVSVAQGDDASEHISGRPGARVVNWRKGRRAARQPHALHSVAKLDQHAAIGAEVNVECLFNGFVQWDRQRGAEAQTASGLDQGNHGEI